MKITKFVSLGIMLICSVTACSGNTQYDYSTVPDSGSRIAESSTDQSESPTDEKSSKSGYWYDPNVYKMADTGIESNRIIVQSFDELENRVRSRRNDEGDGYGLIVQCSVSGPSINRIIEVPLEERIPGEQYGGNYVITPVKIEKVLYAPEEIDIAEDQITYIHEPFFYVEENTKDYCEYYDVGTVILTADKYTPLQEGYHYIVYLGIYDHDETYNGFLSYNGVVYPQICYVQEGVYCLEEEEIAKNVINQYKGEFYWDIWREVVDHYGDVDLNGRNSVSQKYE